MDSAHPPLPTTLTQLAANLAGFGQAPAIIALDKEGLRTTSFAELSRRVLTLAAGLAGAGLGPGGRAVVMGPPSAEWITAGLAVAATGAAVVPLDAQFRSQVAAGIAEDCRPLVWITTRELAGKLAGKVEGPRLLILDDNGDDSLAALAKAEPLTPPAVGPQDEAALFYTSGTTGPPKGVPLSQANLAFQYKAVADSGLLTPADRVLMPLPLHHVYPLVVGTFSPLALGVGLVLPQALTGPELARALSQGEVTAVLGVPRLYRALVEGIRGRARATFTARLGFDAALAVSRGLNRLGVHAGRTIFRSLHRRVGPHVRLMASGGAALDPDLAAELEALGWRVAIGYGLTETSPLLCVHFPDDPGTADVGRPLEGVELRLDPSGLPEGSKDGQAESGHQGEVQVKGPGVFAGYLNLPDKTREAFTPDGWFRTGDLGELNGNGALRLTGRASTVIVTEGGEKVQPDEVEELLARHPLVHEVAVLGRGGKVVALAVPEVRELRRRELDDPAAEQAAVRQAVSEAAKELPSYARPGEVAVSRTALERTRLGKVRRHLLVERFEQALKGVESAQEAEIGPMDPAEMVEEDRELLADAAAGAVWEWLAQEYPQARLTPDTSPQLDLGVDSLEWMRITLEIRERTGVALTEEAVARVDTVRDLLEEVAEARRGEAGGAAAEPAPDPLREPDKVLDERQKRWLEPLSPGLRLLADAAFWLDWLAVKGLFRLEVRGRDNLPDLADPDTGPVVFAPNHLSYLDPFVLLAALGRKPMAHLHVAGWTGAAFHNPLFAGVSRLAQAVPLSMEGGAASSLAFGSAVLARGHGLVWFPEGRRSPDGTLKRFKPGLGMILAAHPALVVPVHIAGTDEALPPDSSRLRPVKVRVCFGQPVPSSELAGGATGNEAAQAIVAALHDRVAALGRDGCAN